MSLDGSTNMLELNKQEFGSQPNFKDELVNIDVPKIVDKNGKNSLSLSRSINDMNLIATASLNAKTTTASDITSNMTNNLKQQIKKRIVLKRDLNSESVHLLPTKKSLKP